jgi:hypothetical protein
MDTKVYNKDDVLSVIRSGWISANFSSENKSGIPEDDSGKKYYRGTCTHLSYILVPCERLKGE